MMSDASTAVASTVSNDSSEASPGADINQLRAFGIDLAAGAPRPPTLYAVANAPKAAPGSLALSTKSFPPLASACQGLVAPPTNGGMMLPSKLPGLGADDLMNGLLNGHLFSPPVGKAADGDASHAKGSDDADPLFGAQLVF